MSQISGSSCLYYNMHIPPPCLKSTVKAKTDDSLWGKTPCGSIKLSIQLLTGLMHPFPSTELERAILPQAAQGWPKGRHSLANKTWQPRRVPSPVLGCTLQSQRPPSEMEPEMLFQCERSCVARVVDTCKRQRKNQHGFYEAKSCLQSNGG